MRSGNPEDIWESPGTQSKVALPLACSVLLHAGVMVWFAREAFEPSADARVSDARPSLRVSVVMRTPPRLPRPELSQSPGSLEEQSPEAEAALADEAASTEVVARPTGQDGQETQRDTVASVDVAAEAEEQSSHSTAAWTPSTVRAAVSTYVSNQRDTQIEAWVAGCILEQKTKHTRDCKEQRGAGEQRSASTEAGRVVADAAFAAMTRKWRQAQVTGALEERKRLINGLMDAEGPLVQLAADRYALDLEIVRYLNGNPSPYGPRNQFICGGKRVPGASLRLSVPCVYEYTGFVIERPEQRLDPDVFRVVPALFGTAR